MVMSILAQQSILICDFHAFILSFFSRQCSSSAPSHLKSLEVTEYYFVQGCWQPPTCFFEVPSAIKWFMSKIDFAKFLWNKSIFYSSIIYAWYKFKILSIYQRQFEDEIEKEKFIRIETESKYMVSSIE